MLPMLMEDVGLHASSMRTFTAMCARGTYKCVWRAVPPSPPPRRDRGRIDADDGTRVIGNVTPGHLAGCDENRRDE